MMMLVMYDIKVVVKYPVYLVLFRFGKEAGMNVNLFMQKLLLVLPDVVRTIMLSYAGEIPSACLA